MSGVVPAIPRLKFTNATGVPVVSGSVAVYLAGTNTLANTYQDKALTILNNNPVPLDGNGEALFWLDPSLTYKFLLKDANNATVTGWPVDNILGGGNSPTLQQSYVDTFSGDGSQTVFTLSAAPGNVKDTNVYVGGVYQKKSAYNLAGSTITFVAAPTSGTNNIEVTYYVLLDFTGLAATIAGYSAAASASASDAQTSALAASTSETNAAGSVTAINNRIYPGTYATAPTTRPDGSAIQAGDEYFDSTLNKRFTYSSSTWVASDINTANLASSSGSSLVGFIQAGTGAVADTVQNELRNYVSLKQFGAVGDGITDDTAAINAAYLAAKTLRKKLRVEALRYKVTSTLDFSDSGGTGETVDIIADRPGYDRQSETGAIIEYYGTGFAYKFGSSWAPQVIDGLSVLSKAAGQSGVMAFGSRPQLRNIKITNCDQVGLQLGGGTSSAQQSFYGRYENIYIDYPGGTASVIASFSGPVGVKGIWVCGGFPASNANQFTNCIVYGGYDKRVVFDGGVNRWRDGDLSYISGVATSSIFEINGNNNRVSGFYIEPGLSGVAPANYFVFGSAAVGNEIVDYYTTSQITADKIQDGGYNNRVRALASGVNFPTLARNLSGTNLIQNPRFYGTNGSPSISQSPYGWVNFGATAFNQSTASNFGEKATLTATVPASTGISCIQYLWSSTAGRDRFGLYSQLFFRGRAVSISCLARCSVVGLASVRVTISGTSNSFSTSTRAHSGSGNWELLAATVRIPDDVALADVQVQLRGESTVAGGVVEFSQPVCVIGLDLPQYTPSPLFSTEAILQGRFVKRQFVAFTDADATPSVADANNFDAINTGATTITNFTNGLPGQEIKVFATTANTTIANNSSIQTTTGANKTLSANTLYKFVLRGTKWIEY